MSDIDYQIECITRDLAAFLVRDFSLTLEEALRAVYNSETYSKLVNIKTGLYFQSSLYVYDYLKTELQMGKLYADVHLSSNSVSSGK
jgi:hypothetical protein